MGRAEKRYMGNAGNALRSVTLIAKAELPCRGTMAEVLWKALPLMDKAAGRQLGELLDGFYVDDAFSVTDCFARHRRRLGRGNRAAAVLTAEMLYCFGWLYGIDAELVGMMELLGGQMNMAEREGEAANLIPLWLRFPEYFAALRAGGKNVGDPEALLAVKLSAGTGKDRMSKKFAECAEMLLAVRGAENRPGAKYGRLTGLFAALAAAASGREGGSGI